MSVTVRWIALCLAVCCCWPAVVARPDAKPGGAERRVQGEWHATSWEPCEPEKVFQSVDETERWIVPVVGVQRRTLTCISANASVLPPPWCDDDSATPAPVHQRRCVVVQSCRLADWSPWETQQQGCRGDDDQVVPEIQVRRRRLVQAPVASDDAECRPWEEKRIVDEPSQLPLCNQRYKWQPSPWSACRANAASPSSGPPRPTTAAANDAFQPICGGGVQMRSLTCLRLGDSRPVNSKLCRALTILPIIQHCEVPCDSDCQVSEWSAWSPCAAARCVTTSARSASGPLPAPTSTVYVDDSEPKDEPFGDDGKRNAGAELTDDSDRPLGYQFRQRRIVSNASADGTECPALSQTRRCRTDWRDACTRWEVQPLLDTCHLADNATCGPGYRELVFRCRRYDGVTVDDDQCSHTTLPPLEQVPCTVHCPSDCVMSPWSEWTACLHQGRRRRTRYVIGLPLPGGEPCPAELMEEELCSPEQQQLERFRAPAYNWWPLPWAACRLSTEGSLCGSGVHAREVRCTRDDGEHVDDDLCALLARPDSVRPCSIPCPEECRLSDWSEWSQCSDQSDEDAIQSRIRVVLQQPGSSGASASNPASSSSLSSGSFQFPCPPLIEKRSCLDWLAQQDRFSWHLTEWSACHLASGAKCGSGISVRSAACRDGNNATVEPSLCFAKLMGEYRSLELYRECRVPCRDAGDVKTACSASPIPLPGAWSPSPAPCPRNCIGTRSVPGSDCDDGDGQQEDCPCERITLELEDWSACVLDDHLRSCGRGRQLRRRKCVVTSTGQLAPLHWCNEDDYETRSCEIPCPVDCRLSAWSSWTPCNATCGPGAQRRSRKIEVRPADGGRPCGSMEEVQPCRLRPCDAYRWRTSDWTPCHLADARCGDGLQTRYVRCVDVAEDVVVDDGVCDSSAKPPGEQSCRIACPGECVLSTWTPWSACRDCQGERRRERSIVRNPVYNRTCPQLEEVESCSSSSGDGALLASQFCFAYQWQVSEWSSCLPLGGSNCGEGVRTRIASCVRGDGYVVDPRHCDPHTKPGLTEMWCHVECPIDCQISAWSAWDDSECAPCGHHSGLRSRHREILMINNQYGRACPSTLRQQLPCPYRPCYEWRPSNWSHCHLEGAQCGTGRRIRLEDCVLADTGRRVDPEFCRLSGRRPSAETAECKVLCTFEKLVKSSIDEVAATIRDGVSTLLPASEQEITVSYYPTDGEFNIWMVAMIAIGSLFLVFVGVTIFLICSSREEASCKRQMSVAGPSHEFRTANRVHRVSNGSH